MRKHQGWIALDIDGTLTDATHHVPPEVASYLSSLYQKGWELIFLTGRPFSFGIRALQFNFPFYLALQNGADILEMPRKHLVSRCYLPASMLQEMEKIYEHQPEDFIVYSGVDHGDFCYFRPQKFSERMLRHLQVIMPLSNEPWKAVPRFDLSGNFPLIKCLGTRSSMQRIHAELSLLPQITATFIRDPFAADVYLNLVTHSDATKGKALRRVREEVGTGGPIIAGGDDLNDISMLQIADYKIVLSTAPKEMHAMADFLAKPSTEMGIIEALEEATSHVKSI